MPLWCLQRGLFERHKLLFALMLTNKILVSAGKVKNSDVDVLLKGGGALDIASVSATAVHRAVWGAAGLSVAVLHTVPSNGAQMNLGT